MHLRSRTSWGKGDILPTIESLGQCKNCNLPVPIDATKHCSSKGCSWSLCANCYDLNDFVMQKSEPKNYLATGNTEWRKGRIA